LGIAYEDRHYLAAEACCLALDDYEEATANAAAAAAHDEAVCGKNQSKAYRIERAAQAILLRDILGNPFGVVITPDPTWLTSTVTSLAQAIYTDRAFDRLPILADALEDAGCTNQDILAHCRSNGEHARGCWVVDLLLGRQ
jgi:hypothetical protein